jgi:hypothetical protein
LTPAVWPIRIAAVSAPQPVSSSSHGRCALISACSSCSSASIWSVSFRICETSSRAIRARTVAGSRRSRLSVRSSSRVNESAPGFQRRLELRAQRDEMAAEPGLHASPLSDKVLAMVREQPDFHRLLVQICDRELVDPVLDDRAGDRAGDRERIDLIGLPRSPLTAARGAHPMRSDTNDPLPGRQQRRSNRCETSRQSSIAQTRSPSSSRPLQLGQMPVVCRLDLALAAHSAGSVIDGCQRVRPLVRVRPNHDH